MTFAHMTFTAETINEQLNLMATDDERADCVVMSFDDCFDQLSNEMIDRFEALGVKLADDDGDGCPDGITITRAEALNDAIALCERVNEAYQKLCDSDAGDADDFLTSLGIMTDDSVDYNSGYPLIAIEAIRALIAGKP